MNELIDLINEHDFSWTMADDQRLWDNGFKAEKKIKEMLKDYLWDDIEPFIQEWRKKEVSKLF